VIHSISRRQLSAAGSRSKATASDLMLQASKLQKQLSDTI
jgi:hypothetical protein